MLKKITFLFVFSLSSFTFAQDTYKNPANTKERIIKVIKKCPRVMISMSLGITTGLLNALLQKELINNCISSQENITLSGIRNIGLSPNVTQVSDISNFCAIYLLCYKCEETLRERLLAWYNKNKNPKEHNQNNESATIGSYIGSYIKSFFQ